MNRLFTLLTLPCLACTHTAAMHSAEMHSEHGSHRFDDADAWAARFEDPARDSWQKPDEVLKALALRETDTIADIGAATGYFPVRFAHAVPQGHVYGVDVESSMVTYLAHRAEREGLKNLTAVLGSADEAKLPVAVDVITIVNTYHHIEHRPAYFTKLGNSLKPGGRLVVIDFTMASPMGPPASAKVPPETVAAELAEAGFKQTASHPLPEQFFLVFTH